MQVVVFDDRLEVLTPRVAVPGQYSRMVDPVFVHLPLETAEYLLSLQRLADNLAFRLTVIHQRECFDRRAAVPKTNCERVIKEQLARRWKL